MKLSCPRAALAVSLAVLLVSSTGCIHAAPPVARYFQPTAQQIGPFPNSYGEAVIPAGGLIAVQGDEVAYGVTRGRSRRAINGADEGQGPLTISEALRKVVKGVKIENRGYPGDTVAASAARWANAPRADLLILVYGFGDERAHTTITDFAGQLTAMIKAAQAQGTTVFVIVPPNVSKVLLQSELFPYFYSARDVATKTGAEAFDASAALTRIKAPPPKSAAQTSAGYQAIAADMIPYIKVIGPPRS